MAKSGAASAAWKRDPTTIWRWVQHDGPELEERLRRHPSAAVARNLPVYEIASRPVATSQHCLQGGGWQIIGGVR